MQNFYFKQPKIRQFIIDNIFEKCLNQYTLEPGTTWTVQIKTGTYLTVYPPVIMGLFNVRQRKRVKFMRIKQIFL